MQSLAPASLTDGSGNEYPVILERGPSYIVFPGGGRIMWNPKVKQPEGIIIKGRYLLFIMPENNIPVLLNYSYYYKPDRNARKANNSNLSVKLMK
jgi:hypothetical protein